MSMGAEQSCKTVERKLVRVLVLGASGMLGRSLMREFKLFPKEFEALGTYESRALSGLVKLDMTQEEDLQRLLDEFGPNIIINCAAQRDPEMAAKDMKGVKKLNVEACGHLARKCAEMEISLVHLSTDYVFDGGIHTKNPPPYDTHAETHPLNFYGETKRDSETEVLRETNAHALVVRVPVMYAPDSVVIGESATLAVAKSLLSNDPVYVDAWGERYPTFVDDVAVVIRRLVTLKTLCGEDVVGVLHCSSPQKTTKFEIAKMMGTILGRSTDHVLPDEGPSKGEPRPRNTQLNCDKTWEVLGYRHPFKSLEDGLALALVNFRKDFT